jgi:hypothetical protein
MFLKAPVLYSDSTFHVPSCKSFCLLGRLNWVYPGGIDSGFLTMSFLWGGVVSPTPNLEDQVSVFVTPRDRGAQLNPQALGTHFGRLLRPI